MVYKCKACGKSMLWNGKELQCICGSTDYKIEDNFSNSTCDICGATIADKKLVQTCENCGASVINKRLAGDITGIVPFTVDRKEAVKNLYKHLSKYDMALKGKDLVFEEMYLPYLLVDGTCRLKDGSNQKYEIKHDDFPVFNGDKKMLPVSRSLTYDTDIKNIEKFEPKCLSGYISDEIEQREDVFTQDILQSIMKVDSDSVEECKDIAFEASGKMRVLFPLYKILMNKKYEYFVNGQTGEVIGKPVPNKKSALLLALYQALATVILVCGIITITGGITL